MANSRELNSPPKGKQKPGDEGKHLIAWTEQIEQGTGDYLGLLGTAIKR